MLFRSELQRPVNLVNNFGPNFRPNIFEIIIAVGEGQEAGRVIGMVRIYKKIKGDDPNWFYIHHESYPSHNYGYYECESFEDFSDKINQILLEY